MNESQINSRLSWLSFSLAAQRNNISKILLRLKGMGLRAGTSLGLHAKFVHLLEQIAIDREKELDLLHEIDEVEKQHENLRKHNLLRRVPREPKQKPNLIIPAKKAEKDSERLSWLKIFWFILLLYAFRVKPKKQDLTMN